MENRAQGKGLLQVVLVSFGSFALWAWFARRNCIAKDQRNHSDTQDETTSDAKTHDQDWDATQGQAAMLLAREHWQSIKKDKKKKIPVTVIAGPLGAGKTTLTKRIVEAIKDFTLGLIVNDFASLNVDAETLRQASDNPVMELSGGCICCSLESGLVQAISDMLAAKQGTIDYLVVETSGLTDPTEVVRIIENQTGNGVRLDSVVVVVDADRWENAPLQYADTVVLNKIDLVESADALVEKLRAQTSARVIPAKFGDVPLESVLDVVRVEPEREGFGRMATSKAERATLGGYALPEKGDFTPKRSGENRISKNSGHKNEHDSEVFKSSSELDLGRLQILFASPYRESLARMKGQLTFTQVLNHSFSFEMSGRMRLDVTRHKKFFQGSAVAIVTKAGHGETFLQQIKTCCSANPLQGSNEVRDWITGNGNLQLFFEDRELLVFRLSAFQSYGPEEPLRLRFGIQLNTVNEVFCKCINSSSLGLIALPVETAQGLGVGISSCTPIRVAQIAIESAIQTTFRVEFSHVSLCGCD